jgi:phage terminase large subunit
MEENKQLVDLFETFQKDPFFWLEQATGLIPQPPKPHTFLKVNELLTCSLERFEQIAHELTLADFEPFEKGKHITWQQTIIIIAYARALNGTLPRRIAIITGKGLGKTAVVSWLLCHFLYSFPLAKIMATAPTSDQMFAALWSEVAKIIADMKSPFKETFEWQTAFVRHKEAPYTAFARAKTADSIEALRGIHADSMMALVDESSGVADEIINTGWSTMTNENKVMILISNFSGNDSLIERIHATQDSSYVKLRFSTEDSPIVDQKEVKRRKEELIAKGIDPRKDRDYCIDILGIAPPDTSEFAGWYRFFSDDLIDKCLRPVNELDNPEYRQRPALGVDPAGEGNDTAPGVLRSFKWAKEMFELAKSSSDTIAGAIATVFDNVPYLVPSRAYVDAFGIGHDVSQKVLANSSDSKKRVIRSVLVGEQPPESYKGRYINVRAFIYDAMRVWFENGGRIETDVADAWRKELKSIYAKKTASGKLQIMSKAEMRTKKLPSPNKVDALSLTFVFDAPMVIDGIYRPLAEVRDDGYGYRPQRREEKFNPHSLIPNSF